MAKNINIIPGDAQIDFSGASASTITLNVLDDGAVVFKGAASTLLSIADSPSTALDVNGNAQINGQLYLPNLSSNNSTTALVEYGGQVYTRELGSLALASSLSLNDLTDVYIDTNSLESGNLLMYNSSTATFEVTDTISSILDITEVTSSVQDILIFSSLNSNTDIQYITVDNFKTDLSLIDGSGTTNYLPIWTDADTLGNSILYSDGTNVGIGTTSPLRKLHVVGNFAVNAGVGEYYGVNITGGEGVNPNILIGDWHDSSANLSWDSANNLLRIDSQHSTSGAPIVFSGNDSALEYGRFTANGSFGIGTSIPSSDGYSFAQELVIVAGASPSDGAGITINSKGRRYGVIAFGDTADVNAGEIYYDHTHNAMTLRTNANKVFTVQNGQVVATEGHGTSANWYNGYNYSQVGHLPLAGGIMVGNIDMNSNLLLGELQADLELAWTSNMDVNSSDSGFMVGRYTQLVTGTKPPVALDNANWLIQIQSHPSGGVGTYGHQISGVNREKIYFRKVTNGAFDTWRQFWSEADFSSTDISNWNTAYNDKINSAAFNTGDGILTLTQQDGGILTVDLDGRYLTSETDSQTLTWTDGTNNLAISGGNSVTITGFADAAHTHAHTDITDFDAEVSAIITADVDKAFIDALNIDADTLDGQNGTYYLDYNNLTNTPTYDNYNGWDLDVGGISRGTIISGENVGFAASTGINIAFNTTGNITTYSLDTSYVSANYAALSHIHSTSDITSGTFVDARIAQSNVTQHQAALSIGWAQLTNVPTYDNYVSWNLKTNGVQRTTIGSGGNLDIVGTGSTSVSYSAGGVVTINSTDTNTTYSAGTGITLTGTSFSINSGYTGFDTRYYTETEVDDGFLSTTHLQNITIGNADSADVKGVSFYYLTSGALNKPTGTDHALFTQSYSTAWATQMASDWRTNKWYVRTQENTVWKTWQNLWTSLDFTSTDIANWGTAHGWGNHATQGYALMSYVDTQIANLVDSSPGTLDTLNELAAALGDDPNFATTVSTSIGERLKVIGNPLDGMIPQYNSSTVQTEWTDTIDLIFDLEDAANVVSGGLDGQILQRVLGNWSPVNLSSLGFDNYGSWEVQANGVAGHTVGSGGILNIVGTGDTTVSRSGNTITINSTDTNNTYTATNGLTLVGGSSIQHNTNLWSMTALIGSSVISQIVTDSYGHINSVVTRNLTLSDLGYAGSASADNYGYWLVDANSDFTSGWNKQVSSNTRIDFEGLNPIFTNLDEDAIGGGYKIQIGITNQSITSSYLAINAVTSSAILDSSVTVSKLASNSVTNVKIAGNAVTSDKISAGSVGNPQLASSAVTNDKLASGSVYLDNLSISGVGAVGKVIGYSTSGSGLTYTTLPEDERNSNTGSAPFAFSHTGFTTSTSVHETARSGHIAKSSGYFIVNNIGTGTLQATVSFPYSSTPAGLVVVRINHTSSAGVHKGMYEVIVPLTGNYGVYANATVYKITDYSSTISTSALSTGDYLYWSYDNIVN